MYKMPKIGTHHIYGHYCHRGGDRSGYRVAHKFHVSRQKNPDLGGYNMKVVKDDKSSLEAVVSNEGMNNMNANTSNTNYGK